MARDSVLSRGRRAAVLDPAVEQERRLIVYEVITPLYESIDAVSQSIVDRLRYVDQETSLDLPFVTNITSRVFKVGLPANWREMFTSEDDFNDALFEKIRRITIGINSGISYGGFPRCRVKRIALDVSEESFIIDLTWMHDPSWWRKLFRRRH